MDRQCPTRSSDDHFCPLPSNSGTATGLPNALYQKPPICPDHVLRRTPTYPLPRIWLATMGVLDVTKPTSLMERVVGFVVLAGSRTPRCCWCAEGSRTATQHHQAKISLTTCTHRYSALSLHQFFDVEMEWQEDAAES